MGAGRREGAAGQHTLTPTLGVSQPVVRGGSRCRRPLPAPPEPPISEVQRARGRRVLLLPRE